MQKMIFACAPCSCPASPSHHSRVRFSPLSFQFHPIPFHSDPKVTNSVDEISITFNRDINTSSTSSTSSLHLILSSTKLPPPPLLNLFLINRQKRKDKKHNTDRVPLHPGPATFSFSPTHPTHLLHATFFYPLLIFISPVLSRCLPSVSTRCERAGECCGCRRDPCSGKKVVDRG